MHRKSPLYSLVSTLYQVLEEFLKDQSRDAAGGSLGPAPIIKSTFCASMQKRVAEVLLVN